MNQFNTGEIGVKIGNSFQIFTIRWQKKKYLRTY